MSNADVAAVRRFNRFYTRQLGLLDQIILDSPYSLTEARILYELALQPSRAAKSLAAALQIDPGYLSRTLQAFADRGLVTRRPSPEDRRQHALSLTAKGRLAFGKLDLKAQDEIAATLARLGPHGTSRLVKAMAAIESALDPDRKPSSPILRAPRPGDIGWVIQCHGAIYARDYGFDFSFEALVAEIAGAFLSQHDATRECCRIAEYDGAPVGSVFVVGQSDTVAKLRLLIVNDAGRGLGLGARLTQEAIAFARARGYSKISLWTQSILLAARKIYQDAGFSLTASEPHRSFGQDLIGETWELTL